MQLDVNEVKQHEGYKDGKSIEKMSDELRGEQVQYSKFYLLTNFVNILTIALAFFASSGNKTIQGIFIFVGVVYVFMHISLNDKAKSLAYSLAILYKKR